MKYTKKQFHEDVAAEATALRTHAKKKEIARLDFEHLDPGKIKNCIYGQMTGDCFSERASRLIFKCCKRYFKHLPFNGAFNGASIRSVMELVNGEYIEGIKNAKDLDKDRNYGAGHYSAIEAYIMTDGAKNKNLIAYLKGETNTLKL